MYFFILVQRIALDVPERQKFYVSPKSAVVKSAHLLSGAMLVKENLFVNLV